LVQSAEPVIGAVTEAPGPVEVMAQPQPVVAAGGKVAPPRVSSMARSRVRSSRSIRRARPTRRRSWISGRRWPTATVSGGKPLWRNPWSRRLQLSD
jgi:hypothetical protein